MSTKLNILLQSGRTVFTLDDLGVIWGQKSRTATRQSARDYATRGSLLRLRQGVYALPHIELDEFIIANKLLVPSYVTGLSVLIKAGMSFQYTDRIFSVAAYGKNYKVGERTFVYSQIKEAVLYNPLGLNDDAKVSVAGVERAITDLIYLTKGRYPFERIKGVDWGLLERCALIYDCALVPRNVELMKERYAF
jgi:predicted transcriptional regulator of viral defense system